MSKTILSKNNLFPSLQWRRSIGADTLLDDFTFPERDAFISLYPQGYCNVDKMVCGVLLVKCS